MENELRDSFRVAILGGSAGSLEPLTSIIADIPVDTNLAIIVVQHLDPAKKSSLIALLRQRTTMRVEALLDGVSLAPGVVYVVAPGDAVTFYQGTVTTMPTGGDVGAQHALDRLASSLASDASLESVLVILSGAGSDGTLGAASFRDSDLPVIAQAPSDARFSSMPESAIEKQYVDEVLSADAIGKRLQEFAARGKTAVASRGPMLRDVDSVDVEQVVGLLKRALGRDFSDYRSGTLSRRLLRRVTMHNCKTPNDYLARFSADKQELQHLADDFLIQVTQFFRDASAFDTLRQEALPALFEDVGEGGELRAWVVGCSTGEEAYSIAILLREYRDVHRQDCSLKIFATDADRAAVDFARAGTYDAAALAPLSPFFRDKYFIRRDKVYQVKRDLRESIVFAAHNVIAEPPFSNLHLITCRNLLIYLNAKIKLALLRLFHFTLRDRGVLFLGSSEFLGRVDRHFMPISKSWRIFRRSDGAPRRTPAFPLFGSPAELQLIAPDIADMPPSLFGSQSLMRGIIEEHGATQLLVDEVDRVAFIAGKADPFLQLPKGEPTEDLLSLALPPLVAPLKSLLNRARQEGYALESGIWCPEGPRRGFMVTLSATSVTAEGFTGHVSVCLSRGPAGEYNGTGKQLPASELTAEMLRREVDATREDMQQTIKRSSTSDEVLRRANEEIMAMNEEFQSANEELEASKEELQSLNDELASANAQLQEKVNEVQSLNLDLENVFNSSDSATLIVDGKLRVKRFTPNIVTLMRLRDADVDRDIGDITRLFDDARFIDDIRESIGAERNVEAEIDAHDGRRFLRRILPYLDTRSRVVGAVVNFIDVSELQASVARDRESTRILRWQAKLLDLAAPIFGRSPDGKINFWNRSAALLWGYSSEEALGEVAHDLLKTRFPAGIEAAESALDATSHWSGIVSQRTKAGRTIDLSVYWSAAKMGKDVTAAVSEVYQDLTATMSLKATLREEQELFHLLFDWTANAEYWTDADGKITYITPAVKEITGFAPQAFIEDPGLLSRIVDEPAREDWTRHVSEHESPPPNQWKSIDVPIRRQDGQVAWVEHRFRIVYSSDSEILGYRGTIRDINEVHRLEGEANRLAYSDPLTALPNRRSLAEKLDEACAAGERSRQQSALVMIDLDHFKVVNDTDGHPVGDRLLVEVAERIKNRLRAVDTVARVGGDEFMLILGELGVKPETASLAAHRICDEIRVDLERHFHLEGASSDHRISASFGLVLFAGKSVSVDELVQRADMALYSAKDQGRNKTILFDPKMQAAVVERLGKDHALAAALREDGLKLLYQAQVDVGGRLTGIEALLRWASPGGELRSPDSFMDALEGQPMVGKLGRWVVEAAMRQLASWSQRDELPAVSMSVNISPGYLLSDGFFDEVQRLLVETAADPKRLIFEVTENALLTDMSRGEAVLRDLTNIGIRISLDDFGTGFSSLSHLKSMPISELKIDQSFVSGLPKETSSAALIEATIAIAKALNLTVIAEGVETVEQAEKLSDMGCRRMQGYLFSKPALCDEFEDQFLRN